MTHFKRSSMDVAFDEQRMVLDYDPDGLNELLECTCVADAGADCTCRLNETEVPAHYEVCDDCRGRGTTTRHIEPDGGGFTASEWGEACQEDPDFAEDYRNGRYDRACPTCDGLRVVPEPNGAGLTEQEQRVLDAVILRERDFYAFQREVAAERAMGA